MSDLLTPQPPPKHGADSVEVWPSFLEKYGSVLSPELIELCRERNRQGIAKYGRPLTTNNGRIALVDKLQELLDACVYGHQDDLERAHGIEAAWTYNVVVALNAAFWEVQRREVKP